MNGEPNPSPQVPVTTLAGIASLSQLLPELPLPSPSTSSSSRSLLFHPRVAEEAQRLLTCQDDTLLTQLAQSLAHTSAQHIELKEQYAGSDSVLDLKSAPPLLQGILCKKPCVFQGPKEGSEGLSMVKDEDEKTVNHNTVPPKASPHLNNISVIRKGPASVSDSGPQVSVKSEPVSNTHTNDSKDKTTLKEEDASSELDKKMKEPVVVLNKLSTEDLRSMGRIPKLIGATGGGHGESGGDRDGMDEKNKKKMDKHDTSQNSASRSTRSGRRDSRKYKEVSSESESEDDKKKPAKYFKNREKEREEKRKKDKADRKRHRTYYDDDDYDPTQTKKKRKGDEESGEEEAYEEDSADEPAPREQQVKRPLKKVYNNKRIERKLVPITEKLTSEELMETNTYQRFNRAIERIFDNTEDLDLNAEIEDDVPQEYLIAKYELSELCAEAAKLKNMGAMATVPPERLVRLLNILEKNIRDGAKVTPIIDDDDEDDDKLWMELVLERILRGMDASLTSMYIITASNMNKRVYLEDVIERCVQFAKFQLSNTIYPSFDPVYRIESKKDGYVGNVKRKRQHNRDVKNRNILGLYNKLHELVGLLADLTHLQPLTDTTVLILSTLGVAPFFVENVSELQLSALRLVTSVFAKYDKHRRLLLDDILASIARLPSSKRSLRTYRLNSDENIQMLTALVLQLIQCMVELPEELGKSKGSQTKSASESEGARESKDSKDSKDSKESKEVKSEGNKLNLNMDRDVLVCNKYETAIRTAVSFLSVFLQKCGSKSEEVNYRPLFENFVQDLLSTVNKPEWPAAELLLSLLGKLLVQNFSNKNIDMSLRVASIDYLGVVAARLRKDAVSSQLKLDTIDQIIGEIREEENKNVTFIEDISSHNSPAENGTITTSSKKKNKKKGGGSGSSPVKDEAYIDPEEERTRFLQRVLLDWLAVNSESEQALLHARHFYIAQWYRDSNSEIRRQKQGPQVSPSKQKKKKRRNRKDDSGDEESTENETDDENERQNPENEALIAEVTRLAEKRKSFLLTKIPALPPATPGAKTQILQTHLDYENAELITRYLAAKRPFSQSFDVYLMQILRVLTESAIAVRTKAMKCLTMVVEADPSVLARSDMQLGVNHSFLDHSTSVREAAVDLVGKFVLSRPELIDKYYDMISARILDTGVSVRKRVIKIMKDICLECPQFPKIPEICVKMIRRVNDEEGIKKLVQEVFQNMWFTPVRERPQLDTEGLLRKVNNITDVVVACKDTGLDWFEQLLQSMFKPKEDKDDVTKVNLEPPKTLMTACKQIVDCLVEHILVLEESGLKQQSEETTPVSKGTSHRLVACLTTLYLFAKIRPQLLVSHAITIQPYLAVKCQVGVFSLAVI
ncbi:nipped-B-like protein A isoform X2 [Oratosquilla oratoria]|uniref:nipped-B-like protein A isoform X2 n=1 Tax=Oratosquilla oratoria TaxID=337810 RepID=UPI003F764A6E